MAKKQTNVEEQKPQMQQLFIFVVGMVIVFGVGILLGMQFFDEDKEEPTTIETYFIDLNNQRHTANEDWEIITHEFDNVAMVLVPQGCFAMGNKNGSADEKPVDQVCLNNPFWLDIYEVSNAQFSEFGGLAEDSSRYIDPNLPRHNLNWLEANAYCRQRGGRLPTEAEWEYALRGASGWIYPWGNTFDEAAVVYFQNATEPAPIGSNSQGITWVGAYDMSGNVWEWTSSTIEDYPYKANDGREDGDNLSARRVLRGGSWDDSAQYMEGTNRGSDHPRFRDIHYGVRCARDFNSADLE